MTVEPWDIKTDDLRAAETINVFVIFCGDAVSEPAYFNSFASENLKINAKGNKRGGRFNVIATIQDCIDAGYMEFSEDGYRLKNMVTENLWCVYDRDFENTDLTQIKDSDNIDWNLSIQAAQKSGLKVGWSNDAERNQTANF